MNRRQFLTAAAGAALVPVVPAVAAAAAVPEPELLFVSPPCQPFAPCEYSSAREAMLAQWRYEAAVRRHFAEYYKHRFDALFALYCQGPQQ